MCSQVTVKNVLPDKDTVSFKKWGTEYPVNGVLYQQVSSSVQFAVKTRAEYLVEVLPSNHLNIFCFPLFYLSTFVSINPVRLTGYLMY